MGPDPKNVIGDFAERTRKNLAVIDALAKTHIGKVPEPKVFEATQLVNSLLGLLVFPQQGWFDDLPKTLLTDLESQGWPHITFTINTANCATLDQLARYLRNAIGHFGLEFMLDPTGDINGLRLWNYPNGDKKKPKNFQVELSLLDVRGVADRFVDLMMSIRKAKQPPPPP